MSILQLPAPKSNADVFPAEIMDPNDLESPPELWPDWCDADTWCVTESDPATRPSWVAEAWVADPEPDEAPDGPTAEDLADFQAWKDELAVRRHLDRSSTMTLDGLAESVAAHFRTWGNDAGDLFARTLEDLARSVRQTSARTPAEFIARRDQADAVARETLEAIAFDEGLASCPCHSRDSFPAAFGHLS